MSLIDELIKECEEVVVSCYGTANNSKCSDDRRSKARSRFYLHQEYLVKLKELKAEASSVSAV